MTGKGVWLEDLTWPEAKQRFDAGRPVIVPIGAAAKEHGHHLPLKTDWVTARALGQRLADRLDVVVAPVVPFGFYPAFTGFAGSQHLEAATFMALMRELIGNLIDHGVYRIVLLNTGVSTEAPLDIVVSEINIRRGVRAWCAHLRRFGRAADALLEVPQGGHGDERETSVMLALDPGRVRIDRLQPGGEPAGAAPALALLSRPFRLATDPGAGEQFTATGALGNPAAASALKGERVLAAMLGELQDAIIAAFPEAFQ